MIGKLLTGAAAAGIGGRMLAKKTAKDQFGFGTEKKVMQSKPAELLGVKPEDVVRY